MYAAGELYEMSVAYEPGTGADVVVTYSKAESQVAVLPQPF